MSIQGSDADYSWELRHDDRVVEYGALSWSDEHPWTGKAATSPYEMGSELFDLACACAIEDCHDTTIDARMEGRPDPRPVGTVSVVLRDRSGAELVHMTARLEHVPVTAEDVQDAIERLRASEEEDRRAAEARRLRAEEPEETDRWFTEIIAPPVIPRPDPPEPPPAEQQRITDLEAEADDLRESVVDPDHCRRKLFEAEQRLAEAQRRERRLARDADESALDAATAHVERCAQRVGFWHDRVGEATETYLRAAALDAEATRLRRRD
ncbi:hypothetical protein ACFYTQ_14425 [Nocardia sp. NPDC004068]|uniref:hypothetical protein n=1 Tax=Nocardia sp. NPDC004068 TaxID=3364303 RepID=UPI003681B937